MPRRRRPGPGPGEGGGGGGPEGGGSQARGSAPAMSAPAPSPPHGAPPLPDSPVDPWLLYCYECGAAVELPEPPPSETDRVCPCCERGFLQEDPPSPPPGTTLFCDACGAMVPTELPFDPSLPPRVCPCCQVGLLSENPRSPSPPPPPPPPHLAGHGFSELDDDDDDDDLDLLSTDYDAAREYIGRFVDHRSLDVDDGPLLGNLAAAAAMSALRHYGHRPGVGAAFNTILQRHIGLPPPPADAGGEPPAPAASIAALPTVEVAELAAVCAICKDDLPLASQARKLPCAHLYHSPCIVTWLEMHNSCPVCRFRIPAAEGAAPPDPELDSPPTRITIRFTTTTRRRARLHGHAALDAPVSASPTQLAQAVTGDGAGGPANSGETVSSEWPPHPESDAVMSEAREGDGLLD